MQDLPPWLSVLVVVGVGMIQLAFLAAAVLLVAAVVAGN